MADMFKTILDILIVSSQIAVKIISEIKKTSNEN